MSTAMANFHCIGNLARPWCCYCSKSSRDVAIKVFLKGDYHLKWWTLSRIAYIMQVGFIQSVEGLKRKKKKILLLNRTAFVLKILTLTLLGCFSVLACLSDFGLASSIIS